MLGPLARLVSSMYSEEAGDHVGGEGRVSLFIHSYIQQASTQSQAKCGDKIVKEALSLPSQNPSAHDGD